MYNKTRGNKKTLGKNAENILSNARFYFTQNFSTFRGRRQLKILKKKRKKKRKKDSPAIAKKKNIHKVSMSLPVTRRI